MESVLDLMEKQEERCPQCGSNQPKVYVHGHYQCSQCRCISDGDCCQGAPLRTED